MKEHPSTYDRRIAAAKATVREKLSSLTKKGKVYRPKKKQKSSQGISLRVVR